LLRFVADTQIQPAETSTRSPSIVFADLAIGGLIGALGGSQGIALPGVILLGLGFDLVAAATFKLNPRWFPEREGIKSIDVVATTAGTFVGWLIGRAFGSWANSVLQNPTGNQTTPGGGGSSGGGAGRTLAAGMVVGAIPLAFGAIPGRMPGSLRRISR
jgi:hypothetical protein